MFTTRPDTIFGATYMVIAPEHPLLEGLASSAQQAAVQQYVAEAANKSDLERTELQKVKSGVDTGQSLTPKLMGMHASWLTLCQCSACIVLGGSDGSRFACVFVEALPSLPVAGLWQLAQLGRLPSVARERLYIRILGCSQQ